MNIPNRRHPILLVLCLGAAVLASAQGRSDPPSSSDPPATLSASNAARQIDGSGGVERAVKKLQAAVAAPRQLFKIAGGDSDLSLEIREDQLDKPYLFSATLVKGTGERGVLPNDVLTALQDRVCSFHRLKDKMDFVFKQIKHRAQPGTPEAKAVAAAYPDTVMATLPFKPVGDPPTAFHVAASQLFLKDFLGVKDKLDSYPDLELNASASAITNIVAYPKNMEVDVRLMFSGGRTIDTENIQGGKNIALEVHYTIMAMPDEEGFERRTEDPRVGFFTASYQDHDRLPMPGEDPMTSFIARWRLEKKEPAAPISDVKEPVVYWLGEDIPEKYRPAVRAGVLAWNKAFEAVGLRNALVVKEVDKDIPPEEWAFFNPASASYNMVQWFMGENSAFAMGPPRVNPINGEIFSAHVRIGEGMVPAGLRNAALIPGPGPSASDASLLERAREGAALLAMRDGVLSREALQEYTMQFIQSITTHEIGHNLGLRHNFKSSSVLPNAEVGKDGIVTASIMDYAPPNIAAPGQKQQGPYFQTELGPYDYHAIAYAYAPLKGDEAARSAQLKAIADRVDKDPRLAYATDGDVNDDDPDTQRHDLGKDPVAYARNQASLVENAWSKFQADASANIPPDQLKQTMGTYWRAASLVLPVIGGVRGGGPRQPFAPVPAAEQERAIGFLNEKILGETAFSQPSQFMLRIKDDREGIRSQSYPLMQQIVGMQKSVLEELYSPARLNKLARSVAYADEKNRLPPSRMMEMVRQAVWSDSSGPSASQFGPDDIPFLRRNLQQAHIDTLIGVLKPSGSNGGTTNPDALSAARASLETIRGNVRSLLVTGRWTPDARKHLESVSRKVDAALKADD